jgi:two-component system, NtrC family, sensor kinase
MNIPLDNRLNIRQKLIIVIIGFMLFTGALGVISYTNLVRVEEKFTLVEAAYEFSNIVLEIRRYEKNYFLFRREDDYLEHKRFSQEALELLNRLHPSFIYLKLEPKVSLLKHELEIYTLLFNKLHDDIIANLVERNQLMQDLRNHGQTLVNLSHELVDYEHQQIMKINRSLKNNVLITILLISFLGILLIVFIFRKVIRPLAVIEQTTQSIAQGRFEKVVVWNTRDEIQRVMLAFNRMVEELERRQDQLVQAQKLSSIGTLASGIAHQVNNPLNNISTSCQILIEESHDSASDRAQKMMTNIEKETFRARDIVRGLLEFSRQQEFVLTENRLSEVADRSLRLISSQVPSGIEIFKQIPEDIVLKMDRQRMQEVFLNLLMNAVQAITPDAGRISIIGSRDEKSGKVIISVEDSGRGVPEKIRSRIFDPFFTTKDVGAGTGLGLYIVYSIIQKHNGTIDLNSLITGGTRFVIELPA